tara:strand:+ start:9329 stop:10060 length:732 start_codon:yes stop_codon:yes gene_type:complete
MARRLLIVRHGQSIWNLESKFTGWTNIPLNKKGKIDAFNMAKTLNHYSMNPSIIYSSIMERAINTSEIINKNLEKEVAINTDWRLNEKHYGTLEGVEREYIRNKYGVEFTKKMRSNYTMMPPVIDNTIEKQYQVVDMCNDSKEYFEKIKYGESKKDVYNRTIPFYLEKIVPLVKQNEFPLLVTHKHTARVLMKYLHNINDKDFEKYKLPEDKIIYLELDDNFKETNYKLLDFKYIYDKELKMT